jgi:hypothetical protein
MKTLCIIVFLLLASFATSQNTTLIQNRNFRAAELKHNLNSSGDSLILEGLRSIIKVVISNDNFSKTFRVVNKNAKIPLVGIPLGRFTTEVQLDDKLIIITLLRHETIEFISKPLASLSEQPTSQTELIAQHRGNGMTTETSGTDLNQNEGDLNQNEGDLNQNEGDLNQNEKREIRFYWIVNFINKGQSSRKVKKLADLETVKRLIRKHEIDHKTKSGMYNELSIWEVYDTSKFMRYKRMNPDYATAKNSDYFNTRPFYQVLSKGLTE